MSEILANIVVQPVDLVITAENNQINFTPEDIQLNIYTAGQGSSGAGGNVGELQFNNGGTIGGAANTLVTANGNVRFTNISNIKINGGNTGYYLQTDGSGNLTWAVGTANVSGNGTSAGSNNQIQLSDGAGNFKVGPGFSFDPSSNILAVPGNVVATNFVGPLSNGTSNIAIATNSNINLTVNGNVSAVVSDNKLTVPSLTLNSSNIALGSNAGGNSQTSSGIAIGNNAGYDLQGANAIAIGVDTANLNQGIDAIAIGRSAGGPNSSGNGQGTGAIAIGTNAGALNQGEYSIAIGQGAGNSQQPNNSIVMNATGANFDIAAPNAFYVKPVRQANSGNVLYYDQATGEIAYDTKPDTNNISNGTSNVTISTANGNITMGVNGTANVVTVTQTGLDVSGNISATNITGNIAGPLANGTSSVSIPTANGNIISNVNGTTRLVVTSSGANVTGTFNATGNLIAPYITANTLITSPNANIANINVSNQANVANLTITAGNNVALGNGASATNDAVSLGYQARANGLYTTALGYFASADAGGTSVGYQAGALVSMPGSGLNQTFVGREAGGRGRSDVNTSHETSIGAYAGSQTYGGYTVAIGSLAGMGRDGNLTLTRGQDAYAIAIGYGAGQEYQRANTIAIGSLAAANNQGAGSIVIGHRAGNNAANNSITIDATVSGLSANIANALFVKPIRNTTSGNVLYYNSTSGEVTFDNATYGCFHKIANVTAAAANTVYNFDWYTDTTAHVSQGVTVTSGQPTRVNIDTAGNYAVFVEMQAKNTDNQDRTAWVWLSKNGTPISETTVKITLLKEWAQVIAKQWALDNIAANDYIEVNFAVDNISGISLEYNAAQTTPFIMPAQPSATLTITPIGA